MHIIQHITIIISHLTSLLTITVHRQISNYAIHRNNHDKTEIADIDVINVKNANARTPISTISLPVKMQLNSVNN